MRVVILVNDITEPGGTERAAVSLAHMLLAEGQAVRLLSLFTAGGQVSFPVEPGVQVTHAGLDIRRGIPQRLADTVRVVNRLGLPRGSVLIGTTVAINTALAYSAARRRGWQTVACEHVNYEATSRVNQLIRRRAYRRVDRLVVLTEAERARYAQDGLDSTIIQNSLPFYPDEPAVLEAPRLLAVGRLALRKGFGPLIELMAPVLGRHPQWCLDIVGDGELRDVLQAQIDGHGLTGRINLVPSTPDIERYYREASVYLMSSLEEPFGIVLIEAKAYGLPIVAFDAPHGPRDIVKPDDGYLVPLDRPDLFAAHTEALMVDAALRRRLGAQARENVRAYLPERLQTAWGKIISSSEQK